MDDKSNKLSDTVNVTMHTLTVLDKNVSFAKVKRNTAFIGNIVSKILEHNKVLDRETLLYSAGLFRNAILELLKSGKAVDLLEMGVLYIKPNGSIDSETPDIEDIPKMTLSFTPSDIAIEAVKDVTAGADISTTNEPLLSALYNIHTRKSGTELSIGYSARITGKRLKIAGNEAKTGLYLASCTEEGIYDPDPSSWISLGMENIVDNTNTKILFNIPDSVTAGNYRLIIKTAYGSGTRINKTVRTGVFVETVSIA
ncbi:DUF4469 domain-containing protein [Treponema sp. UBA7570]|uniref:DUF4469 domain-containing protein n=2 Tax=unclassified Treponema TaxID=2638727 RepID=UPI0025DBF550|nr:DUF4469 domain-containing protein [Treponema sp. UBA7570]